jgi:hypothetical protein
MEQVKDILFGIFAPIHIISKEGNSVVFFEVLTDNLLTGIQISVGVSDEDDLPSRREMEQSRFLF